MKIIIFSRFGNTIFIFFKGLPGTILSADGNSCEEIDLCKENNGGCSHDCHTSYGQVSKYNILVFYFQKSNTFLENHNIL